MENWSSYFATNIKFLRERENLSQEQLSSALAMTRAKIAAFETGHTKNPSIQDLNSISTYFSMSVDLLLKMNLAHFSDSDFKQLKDETFAGKNLRVVVTTVSSNNRENIEYVTVKAKAGYLAGYSDPEFISKLPTFDLPHLPKNKKYRMFPIDGDSMVPIQDGSLIIGEYVDNWFTLKNKDLCVLVTKSQGIVFKEIMNNLESDQTLTLNSLNIIYDPFIVTADDILEIWKYKCFISEDIPMMEELSMNEVFKEIREANTGIKKVLLKIGDE